MKYLMVLMLFVVGCSMGPTSYPGDRTEIRACRWCGGTGEAGPAYEGAPADSGGKCPGCKGAKQLSVLIPGPNHPAVVRGTVRDETKIGDMAGNPDAVALQTMGESRTPGPVLGAVSGAKLDFGGGIVYNVPSTGRIRTQLKPGHYSVTITAPGFQESHQELDVRPRQEPIWAERAHLVTEQAAADETWVDFTLRP